MKSHTEIYSSALECARTSGRADHADVFERALRGNANEAEVARALQAQADARKRADRMIFARNEATESNE